jgi:uncharacterized protein (TIGR03083 family)
LDDLPRSAAKELPSSVSPEPVLVAHLFPELLEQLLILLSSLVPNQWDVPTACSSWSVKDVALHLLGVDVGVLSRRRDGHTLSASVTDWPELVTLVNLHNETWLQATRRMSTPLLIGLLRFVGSQANDFFASLDPYTQGGPVSWAGPAPAPVWLGVAREYTERWHHQQHIRDAVAIPGLKEPRYLAPVLDTFVRALPHTYSGVQAAEGTLVQLIISGPAGGAWSLWREADRWILYRDVDAQPQAQVAMDEDTAWRLLTRGLSGEAARDQVTVTGDRSLGTPVLDMVSIIA